MRATTEDPRSLSRERYGRYAQRYVTSPAHSQGTDLERLVAVSVPQSDGTVLDLATGGGHTALRFAPLVSRVVATDLVLRMVEAARKHISAQGVDNVTYANADVADLPFPNATFGLVTCRIAPHHFVDCARFLQECARVLRPPTAAHPGGMLIVQDHVLPDDYEAGRYVDAFERLRDPSHNRAYTEREWIEMFRDADLSVVHTEQLVKDHPFLAWAERQDCTPQVIERLTTMIELAPEAVREWMQPRAFGSPQAAFTGHHIIIAGRKL